MVESLPQKGFKVDPATPAFLDIENKQPVFDTARLSLL